MQIPGEDKGRDNPPAGGRAFQRIQQDRKARGLDELPTPGTDDAGSSSDKDAPNEQTSKTQKEK
jgi:hypothetical protein